MTLRRYAALNSNNEVVHGFDANADFVANFLRDVVEKKDVFTPSWWTDTVNFHDVTGVEPRPVLGYILAKDGKWLDTNPSLTTDKDEIPADGKTSATVTFQQKGPKAPTTVEFDVNGQKVTETLNSQGQASVTLTSVNSGDIILVTVQNMTLDVVVID